MTALSSRCVAAFAMSFVACSIADTGITTGDATEAAEGRLCTESAAVVARTLELAIIHARIDNALAKARAIAGKSPDGYYGDDWVELSAIDDPAAKKVFRLYFDEIASGWAGVGVWDGVSKRSEQFFRLERNLKAWLARIEAADADHDRLLISAEYKKSLMVNETRRLIGIVSSCDSPLSTETFLGLLREMFITRLGDLVIDDFLDLHWRLRGERLSAFQAEVLFRVLHERGALTGCPSVPDTKANQALLSFGDTDALMRTVLPQRMGFASAYYAHMDTIPYDHTDVATQLGFDPRTAASAEVEAAIAPLIEPVDIEARRLAVASTVEALNASQFILTEHDGLTLLEAAFGTRGRHVQPYTTDYYGDLELSCEEERVFCQLTPPMLSSTHPRAKAHREAQLAGWKLVLEARKQLNLHRPITRPDVPDLNFDWLLPPALGELVPADTVRPMNNLNFDLAAPVATAAEDAYLEQVVSFNSYLKQYLPTAVLKTLDQAEYVSTYTPANGFISSAEFNEPLKPLGWPSWRWGEPRDPNEPIDDQRIRRKWLTYSAGPNQDVAIRLPFAAVPRAMRRLSDELSGQNP